MFEDEIQLLPLALHASIRTLITQIDSGKNLSSLTWPDDIRQTLVKVWLGSDFVAQNCLRDSSLLDDLIQSGDLSQCYSGIDDFSQRLSKMEPEPESESQLMTRLRIFRRREMVRIAWRDLSNWDDITQILVQLSQLAECCIEYALEKLFSWQCVCDGVPVAEDNNRQKLVVVAMGKLGAYELNFSSDIDLIFCYENDGQTIGVEPSISNAEFFNRVARKLIKVLHQVTADGFVFRVDMRLRPFGESGPLVINYNAMEYYYQAHGREWERYAWVKARSICGSQQARMSLIDLLKPFIYRRYIDYGVFDSLRDMKQLITTQYQRKGMRDNIKLGVGGIREIEFIAQVFQLIRGGREIVLQATAIKTILPLLSLKNYLPEFVTAQLIAAYDFLRRVENRLQQVADQQTHDLPTNDLAKLKIAFTMGYTTWDEFKQVLDRHRNNVQQQFEQVFTAPQTQQQEYHQSSLKSVWLNQIDHNLAEQYLQQAGFKSCQQIRQTLNLFFDSKLVRSLSEAATRRLDSLMPLLVAAAAQTKNSDETLVRSLTVIERIVQRSVYLSLLNENPMALSQFVQLCSASPWITAYIAKFPVLLDELIDPRSLFALPDKDTLVSDLQRRIESQDKSDTEQLMNVLRHYKQSNELQVAAADISNAIQLKRVSDHLSCLADAIIQVALELAWLELSERYGRPQLHSEQLDCDRGFAIIAYGKLGGMELGYGSDLDLVFLHADIDATMQTDGKSAISVAEFYIRLGQRVIQLLTVVTAAGIAYQIDMRLRPNGASGFLVSSIGAFQDYQLEQAWTWEHQALVRARAVCGDPEIIKHFKASRYQVLARPRDKLKLQQQVNDMRNKMKQYSKPKVALFDLKLGSGGIADIEFMVQYGVLVWASQYPSELLAYTDNIRLLEKFAQVGVLSESDKILLSDAYIVFRQRLHQCRLQATSVYIDASEYHDLRTAVSVMWRRWFDV